jgi:hypothetical protein
MGLCLTVFYSNNIILSNIGIGFFASSIVSFAFLYNDNLAKKINKRKKRALFFEALIPVLFDSLTNLPTLKEKNCNIKMTDHIVHQHRRFHEDYKRLSVGGKTVVNVDNLKELAKTIIRINKVDIHTAFSSIHYLQNNDSFTRFNASFIYNFLSVASAIRRLSPGRSKLVPDTPSSIRACLRNMVVWI